MSNKPLVSIIVPVYNGERYIKQCIKSILEQSYGNIELLIIDDGSKDSTGQIIKELSEEYGEIMVLKQKNQGVSAARNTGIKAAKGDYICFVDADDYLEKDFVSYMLKLVTYEQSDFAYSIKEFRDNNDKDGNKDEIKIVSPNESVAILLSPDTTVGCWNKIYKSSFLTKSKLLFDEKLFYGEGLQFIINASIMANNIAVGNKKVYHYRRNNPNSATTKYTIDKIINGKKSLEIIGSKIDLTDKQIRNMYNLHMATFNTGAIIKLSEYKNQQRIKPLYQKYRNETYGLTKQLLFENVSTRRKIILIVGLLSPKLLSYLNKKKNQNRLKDEKK